MRAFVEGRITEEQMNNFRQECEPGKGLSSYPHPKLMPRILAILYGIHGVSPVNAIRTARFLKYLDNRGLKDTKDQKVYAFLW